jgi:HD-like signal output (HDOD) protein
MILARAIELLSDANSDPFTLVDLVRLDAAVTADIIHICNSAYYGIPQEVSNLDDAVRFLGYSQLYRMLGLNLSRHVMARALRAYGIRALANWEECVVGALLLHQVAPFLLADPATAYTVGLLRNIGRLAINEALLNLNIQLPPHEPAAREALEISHVGLSQAEVGAMLLEGWRFPKALIEAVRHQNSAPHPDDPPLVTALHLAVRLVAKPGLTPHPPDLSAMATDPALKSRLDEVGLTHDHLSLFVRSAHSELKVLRVALRIEDSPPHPNAAR